MLNVNLINGQGNTTIPLSALSTVSIKPSRGAIPHRDGMRVNVIEGYIRAGVLPSIVLARVQENIEKSGFTLPAGYKIEVGGESAERDTAVGQLLASVGVIVTLLITVVVLSFNSFRISAIIFLLGVSVYRTGFVEYHCLRLPIWLYGYHRTVRFDGLSDKCRHCYYRRVKSRCSCCYWRYDCHYKRGCKVVLDISALRR